MKLFEYIITLVFWLCIGGFWVGYSFDQAQMPLWYIIFVTAYGVLHSVLVYVCWFREEE